MTQSHRTERSRLLFALLPGRARNRVLLSCLAASLLLGTAPGCSTSVVTPPPATALPANHAAAPGTYQPGAQDRFVPAVVGIPTDPGPARTYRIGPFDLLRIEVFQVGELSSEERVNEAGYVVMPLIGNVKVGGLTPQEAEKTIAARLGENYLQDPQVNIFVAEYASQRVTVTGQVRNPGVFPLTGDTTLMQAVALAGGLDDVAKKEEIVVFRKQPTGQVNAYVIDLSSIEEGRLTDPLIVGDDRIVVPKSGAAVLTRAVGNVLTGWAVRAPWF